MNNNILMYPHIALARVEHDKSLCPWGASIYVYIPVCLCKCTCMSLCMYFCVFLLEYIYVCEYSVCVPKGAVKNFFFRNDLKFSVKIPWGVDKHCVKFQSLSIICFWVMTKTRNFNRDYIEGFLVLSAIMTDTNALFLSVKIALDIKNCSI